MIALQLNHISKKYKAKEKNALDSFTLSIGRGEIHAIIGESGCGKTTLLRLIAGLEIPDAGEVFINEKLVSGNSFFIAPEKRHIGFVFQDYALFPHLKVKENIAFGLNNLSTSEKEGRLKKYIDLVGLNGYENRYPHELSGGQQQRVALARSLAIEPAVLLLDEPFSNLDEILKKQMRSEIRQIITRAGATAVFVTHDTNDALSVADKISVIRRGELLQTSSPEEIYNNPVNEYVAKMFGVTNILKGVYKNKSICIAAGTISVNEQLTEDSEVWLSVRPENIEISANGNMSGRVKGTVFAGNTKELDIETSEMNLIVLTGPFSNIKQGDEIRFTIKQYSFIKPG